MFFIAIFLFQKNLKFARGDYLELLHLTIIFLGENPPKKKLVQLISVNLEQYIMLAGWLKPFIA